ncbi:hypothetical protein Tco_0191605 [Tanacetum coccineum]
MPILLPDDPYMIVRKAYLATITNFESEPFKDFRETEIPQPLPIASSPVPPSDDPYLIELQPLAARTPPPSSDHTPISSDPTPASPLTDEEIKVLEPSDTRITSSHTTAPLDSTTPLSPDHPLTQTTPIPTVFRPLYYHRTARMAMYAKLNFMEEHVEILERDFKKLKRSRIAIVKVRWNSKCGPEFTWEREDQMRLKYPHLFSSSSRILGSKFFLRG